MTLLYIISSYLVLSLAEDYYDVEHEDTEAKPEKSESGKQNSSEHSQAKRHVGAPDHGGYQRLMATGSIMTSLGQENNTGPADSIDVVFTAYWQYPAKVRIILPEDKACIEKYRKLHTSKEGNVRTVPTNTEVFLCSLSLCGKSRF